MNNTETITTAYQKCRNPQPQWWMLPVSMAGAFTLWFGPFLGWYSFGSVIFTLFCSLLITTAIFVIGIYLQYSAEKRFFDNPKIHTNDDDCHTCGDVHMFGLDSTYRIPEAYMCRYGKDLPMRYTTT